MRLAQRAGMLPIEWRLCSAHCRRCTRNARRRARCGDPWASDGLIRSRSLRSSTASRYPTSAIANSAAADQRIDQHEDQDELTLFSLSNQAAVGSRCRRSGGGGGRRGARHVRARSHGRLPRRPRGAPRVDGAHRPLGCRRDRWSSRWPSLDQRRLGGSRCAAQYLFGGNTVLEVLGSCPVGALVFGVQVFSRRSGPPCGAAGESQPRRHRRLGRRPADRAAMIFGSVISPAGDEGLGVLERTRWSRGWPGKSDQGLKARQYHTPVADSLVPTVSGRWRYSSIAGAEKQASKVVAAPEFRGGAGARQTKWARLEDQMWVGNCKLGDQADQRPLYVLLSPAECRQTHAEWCRPPALDGPVGDAEDLLRHSSRPGRRSGSCRIHSKKADAGVRNLDYVRRTRRDGSSSSMRRVVIEMNHRQSSDNSVSPMAPCVQALDILGHRQEVVVEDVRRIDRSNRTMTVLQPPEEETDAHHRRSSCHLESTDRPACIPQPLAGVRPPVTRRPGLACRGRPSGRRPRTGLG